MNPTKDTLILSQLKSLFRQHYPTCFRLKVNGILSFSIDDESDRFLKVDINSDFQDAFTDQFLSSVKRNLSIDTNSKKPNDIDDGLQPPASASPPLLPPLVLNSSRAAQAEKKRRYDEETNDQTDKSDDEDDKDFSQNDSDFAVDGDNNFNHNRRDRRKCRQPKRQMVSESVKQADIWKCEERDLKTIEAKFGAELKSVQLPVKGDYSLFPKGKGPRVLPTVSDSSIQPAIPQVHTYPLLATHSTTVNTAASPVLTPAAGLTMSTKGQLFSSPLAKLSLATGNAVNTSVDFSNQPPIQTTCLSKSQLCDDTTNQRLNTTPNDIQHLTSLSTSDSNTGVHTINSFGTGTIAATINGTKGYLLNSSLAAAISALATPVSSVTQHSSINLQSLPIATNSTMPQIPSATPYAASSVPSGGAMPTSSAFTGQLVANTPIALTGPSGEILGTIPFAAAASASPNLIASALISSGVCGNLIASSSGQTCSQPQISPGTTTAGYNGPFTTSTNPGIDLTHGSGNVTMLPNNTLNLLRCGASVNGSLLGSNTISLHNPVGMTNHTNLTTPGQLTDAGGHQLSQGNMSHNAVVQHQFQNAQQNVQQPIGASHQTLALIGTLGGMQVPSPITQSASLMAQSTAMPSSATNSPAAATFALLNSLAASDEAASMNADSRLISAIINQSTGATNVNNTGFTAGTTVSSNVANVHSVNSGVCTTAAVAALLQRLAALKAPAAAGLITQSSEASPGASNVLTTGQNGLTLINATQVNCSSATGHPVASVQLHTTSANVPTAYHFTTGGGQLTGIMAGGVGGQHATEAAGTSQGAAVSLAAPFSLPPPTLANIDPLAGPPTQPGSAQSANVITPSNASLGLLPSLTLPAGTTLDVATLAAAVAAAAAGRPVSSAPQAIAATSALQQPLTSPPSGGSILLSCGRAGGGEVNLMLSPSSAAALGQMANQSLVSPMLNGVSAESSAPPPPSVFAALSGTIATPLPHHTQPPTPSGFGTTTQSNTPLQQPHPPGSIGITSLPSPMILSGNLAVSSSHSLLLKNTISPATALTSNNLSAMHLMQKNPNWKPVSELQTATSSQAIVKTTRTQAVVTMTSSNPSSATTTTPVAVTGVNGTTRHLRVNSSGWITNSPLIPAPVSNTDKTIDKILETIKDRMNESAEARKNAVQSAMRKKQPLAPGPDPCKPTAGCGKKASVAAQRIQPSPIAYSATLKTSSESCIKVNPTNIDLLEVGSRSYSSAMQSSSNGLGSTDSPTTALDTQQVGSGNAGAIPTATVYKCRYCGKMFNRKFCRERHERLHTGVRPYTCDVCDEKFIRLEDKKRHVRSFQHCVAVRRAAAGITNGASTTIGVNGEADIDGDADEELGVDEAMLAMAEAATGDEEDTEIDVDVDDDDDRPIEPIRLELSVVEVDDSFVRVEPASPPLHLPSEMPYPQETDNTPNRPITVRALSPEVRAPAAVEEEQEDVEGLDDSANSNEENAPPDPEAPGAMSKSMGLGIESSASCGVPISPSLAAAAQRFRHSRRSALKQPQPTHIRPAAGLHLLLKTTVTSAGGSDTGIDFVDGGTTETAVDHIKEHSTDQAASTSATELTVTAPVCPDIKSSLAAS